MSHPFLSNSGSRRPSGRGNHSRGRPSRGGSTSGGGSHGGPSRAGPSRAGPSRRGPSRGASSRGGLGSGSRSHRGPDHGRPNPTPVPCTHYDRNCNMLAPCCNRFVCCHIGHDEGPCPHKLNRADVQQLLCCGCHMILPVARSCRYCSRLFGQKSCLICRMWYSGDGFHCNKCGVCHFGSEKLTRHCNVCRRCFPTASGHSGHTCAPPGRDGSQVCVGCGGNTYLSRRPSTVMPCGHVMHTECYMERIKRYYSCPLRWCGKPVVDVEKWRARR